MSFSVFVIWFSMFMSAGAVVTNLYVAGKVSGWLRAALIVTAALAGTYCVSYIWLLANLDQAATWSKTLRPVGMLSWIVPWMAFPCILKHYLEARGKEILVAAEKVLSDER